MIAMMLGAGGAAAQTTVPTNWRLVPDGLSSGDRFRLMFLTEYATTLNATTIGEYNEYIQRRARGGLGALVPHAGAFRVVGCAGSSNVLTNAQMSAAATEDTAIYWVRGDKVADDYADFLDGSWDSSTPMTADGDQLFVGDAPVDRARTGCLANGTTRSANELGDANPVDGVLGTSTTTPATGDAALGGTSETTSATTARRLYGISGVFVVGMNAGAGPAVSFHNPPATVTGPFRLHIDFKDPDDSSMSEPTYGFGLTDISITNATLSDFEQVGTGTYNRQPVTSASVLVTPTQEGFVRVTVPAGVAFSVAGVPNSTTGYAQIRYDDLQVGGTADCPAPDMRGQTPVLSWNAAIEESRNIADVLQGYVQEDDVQIEIEGESYTIIYAQVETILNAGRFTVGTNRRMPRGLVDRMNIHVCNQRFRGRDARSPTTTVWWADSGLDWSTRTSATMHLSLDRPNNPATGSVRITSGASTKVPNQLRSTRRTYDADGGATGGYHYQWLRAPDRTIAGTPIAGATSSTYNLTASDVGHWLRLRVRWRDGELNDEEMTSPEWPQDDDGVQAAVTPPGPGVGNFEPPRTGDRSILETSNIAQAFTTGSRAGGYEIKKVFLLQENDATFDMELCPTSIFRGVNRLGQQQAQGRSVPGGSGCKQMSRVGNVTAGEATEFTLDTTTRVGPNTRMWIVIKDRTGTLRVNTAARGALDAGSLAGWSLDGYRHKIGAYWAGTGHGRSLVTKVVTAMEDSATQETAAQVEAAPEIAPSDADGQWGAGDTVRVSVTFSEAVTVDTTGGTPSIGVRLGASTERTARYVDGSGTATLAFEYTVAAEDGAHGEVWVHADSLALNGGAITTTGNGTAASLAHQSAARLGLARRMERGIPTTPFTATLHGVPDSHDGTTPFTFEVRFSAVPDALPKGTEASATLDVSGGTVTATTTTGNGGRTWTYTVRPGGNAAVAITVPRRTCTSAAALCSGRRALASATSASVEWARPFTGAFASAPREHNGASRFDVVFEFSEQPSGASWRWIRDHTFTATGGTITRARRTGPVRNKQWTLTVAPNGDVPVTLTLRDGDGCRGERGMCTSDGRVLQGGASITIPGPAMLSVADAETREAEGVTLDFVVSLSRARHTATTVAYATSDGSATAPDDYDQRSGTARFEAGETEKTVSVTVRDDAHDEGSETMTLTLSGPSGAKLHDASGIGTIHNTDPMPKAWMVRFGRTVGSQAVDAVTARLDGGGAPHVRVAGVGLLGQAQGLPDETDADDPFALPQWASTVREPESRKITGDDLLLRSSFHLRASDADGAGAAFTAWGNVTTGGFEADVDDVTMDGDVTTGFVGFDAEWERALAGVMLSRSRGTGGYRLDAAMGADAGKVESDLTSVYPYGRMALTERVSAWGLAGAGSGAITLDPEGARTMKTDLSMRMAAAGARGQVLDGTGPSRLAVNVRTDAMWVGTQSDALAGELLASEGDATRLRLIVDGERTFETAGGGALTPSLELGLRHDGGDAETGAGVELGAGLRYSRGLVGFEARARMLAAHEESGYEEWGASAVLRVSPGTNGRGLTLSIAPEWGRSASGAQGMWNARDARALEPSGEFEATRRLVTEMGYGLGVPGSAGVVTPYAGLSVGEGGGRTMRGGARFDLGRELAIGVEATRSASSGDGANEVRLRAALSF